MTAPRAVETPHAPRAIGPYSQAMVHGGLVFTAGQIALDPATGTLVGGGDAAKEAEQVLTNLAAVLEAAGSDLGLALRCDVYLVNLKDFEAVNAVYARRVGVPPPARVTVQAAALPRGARVEIAAIAALRDAG
jgi:2-iminobutanoate/2-iminopropanoate deaminase